MTLYRDLLDLGYSDAFIRKTASQGVMGREVSIFIKDTPDVEPIVGLRYEIDYRSEEESGRGELAIALGIGKGQWQMDSSRKDHIARFKEFPSLVISTSGLDKRVHSWGHDVTTSDYTILRGSLDGEYRKLDSCYDAWFSYSLTRAQGLNEDRPLTHSTIPKMKAISKNLGLTGLPKKRGELIHYIESSPEYTDNARRPDVWPGWFHTGRTLVLRANDGVTASVLNLIYEASAIGTLAMEDGIDELKRAILIYDGEDVGPLLTAERIAYNQWVAQAELDLIPVETELAKREYQIYYLGDPALKEDEEGNLVTKYFINVHLKNNFGQIMDYYTLEELTQEKFIKDAKARHAIRIGKSKV